MKNSKKGASIYFALDIMAIMMAIIIGVSTVILVQLSNLKESGDSVVSFYAADAGIERGLWEASVNNAQIGDSFQDVFYNEEMTDVIASYNVTIVASSTEGCNARYYCIRSVGKYEASDTRRGIQISR